jgi:hypothetical protein
MLRWQSLSETYMDCVVGEYMGIVALSPDGSEWLAVMLDAHSMYPAKTLFASRQDAQVWVEQCMTELVQHQERQET